MPVTDVRGRVIDEAGDPIAGVRLFGAVGNRRYGVCDSESDGAFQMRIPQDIQLDAYQAWLNDESRDVELVRESPLVLRVKRQQ